MYIMSNIHKPWFFILIHQLFICFLVFSSLCSSCYASKLPYEPHCNLIVPAQALYVHNQAPNLSIENSLEINLFLPNAYLSIENSSKIFHNLTLPGFLTVSPHSLFPTKNDGIFKVDATLDFQNKKWKHVHFSMSGFYSRVTGKACMVGTGIDKSSKGNTLPLSAVVKLYYPITSSISNCVVRGTIESLNESRSINHFDRVSISEYSDNGYVFTKIPQVMNTCLVAESHESESIAFDSSDICSVLTRTLNILFALECDKKSSTNCGAFSKFMDISRIHCRKDGKINLLIHFTNTTNRSGYYSSSLIPSRSAVSEGFWDSEKKRLCLIACKVLLDSSIGECDIGLTLWFPSFYTLENRNVVIGRMWSTKDKNHSTYFDMISLRSISNMLALPNIFYKYSANSLLKISCDSNDKGNTRDKIFQEVILNKNDLKFDITVKDSPDNIMWGYATPLFVEDNFYGHLLDPLSPEIGIDYNFKETDHDINQSLWKVSYQITYTCYNFSKVDSSEETTFSAEGFYNSRTGRFCMVGCRLPNYQSTTIIPNGMDCEIQIDIQLSPLNNHSEGNNSTRSHLSGTIKSTRKESDPLYFKSLNLSSSSIYNTEAEELVQRMDIEIVMVLISLTLSCIFVYFQLSYIKKNQHILPSVSIAMLVILVMGHVIPLVLNIEALFANGGSKKNVVMLKSGGWLEANEIVVRIMTMVALFLYSRLLQIVWPSVSLNGKAKIRTSVLCIIIYCVGIATSMCIGLITTWESIIPYFGLVLDFFLLPQIILNVISASKQKVLVPIFYVGTSVVRALPHVYDAYRNRYFMGSFEFSYIYAYPEGVFFSSFMNIFVPSIGAILVVIICLQQKLGGDFFLPRSLRRRDIHDSAFCLHI